MINAAPTATAPVTPPSGARPFIAAPSAGEDNERIDAS